MCAPNSDAHLGIGPRTQCDISASHPQPWLISLMVVFPFELLWPSRNERSDTWVSKIQRVSQNVLNTFTSTCVFFKTNPTPKLESTSYMRYTPDSWFWDWEPLCSLVMQPMFTSVWVEAKSSSSAGATIEPIEPPGGCHVWTTCWCVCSWSFCCVPGKQ